jgi:tripartite-type tricarboxylate transporter receptor subunit TctC
MPLSRRRFELLALAAGLSSFRLAAQPARAIRLIIPGPPGGASDIMARILSEDLSHALGQPVVIEPRPGAGGNVAADMVAKSAPDGQTLLFGDIGPLAINATLFPSLPYDPVRDFEPIAKVAVFPWIVVAHPSLGAQNLKAVFEVARQTPGGLSYATPGLGTPMHLTGEFLKSASGANFVHVPYRGGGPATLDVVAGHLKLGIVGLPPAVQHVRSGALVGIGVSTAVRAGMVPDVPTLKEGGLADFDAGVWYGILAPRGTPRAVVDKVNAAIDAALRQPANIEKLAKQGVAPSFSTPEAFRAFIEAEGKRWAPMVRASGAKPE